MGSGGEGGPSSAAPYIGSSFHGLGMFECLGLQRFAIQQFKNGKPGVLGLMRFGI